MLSATTLGIFSRRQVFAQRILNHGLNLTALGLGETTDRL